MEEQKTDVACSHIKQVQDLATKLGVRIWSADDANGWAFLTCESDLSEVLS